MSYCVVVFGEDNMYCRNVELVILLENGDFLIYEIKGLLIYVIELNISL